MINLCSYFTDNKYILALQLPKMPINILQIPKMHLWSRQLVSTWRSSRGWCLPPRPPPLPRAPLSFQAWSAFQVEQVNIINLLGVWNFSGGTSQHHKLIRCLPFWEGQVNLNCNLYLIMVCALIQLCMLAIPSIIPFGEKEILKILHLQVFLGTKKKTQYFTWISSSPVIGFLLFFGGILADFWSSGEIIFMQNTCCWYLEIQTLRRTNESLNQSHKYNFGSPHSAPLSIPFNFCQQDLATTGDVLSNLHS